jgi:6-phosphogluconolactonase (cycloisomerase 2 family)
VVYTCTEDIAENGKIIAYSLDAVGNLIQISQVDAGGTSTCYLTIDRAEKNLIAVNYWDSTIVVIPISESTGEFIGPVQSKYDPKCGNKVIAAAKKDGGVNHSHNDENTIQMRQKDPHSHALVLDPYFGRVAYVPCLGKDVIREFLYDKENGAIQIELNSLPSGLRSGHADGPRYLVFHPLHNMMYVVNELSSTVRCFLIIISMDRQGSNQTTNISFSWDRLQSLQSTRLYFERLMKQPRQENAWIAFVACPL